MEQLLLKLAGTIVSAAYKRVLTKRHNDLRGSLSLSELVETRKVDGFVRRKFARHVETITDELAQQLGALYRNEFTDLDSGDQVAATRHAIVAFDKADVSDKGLFAVDLSADALSDRILSTKPGDPAGLGLAETGEQFYRLLVHTTCECLVRLILSLPEYQPRALTELLDRASQIEEQLSAALKRLPTPSLYAPNGSGTDDEFRSTYLNAASKHLDELELFGVELRNYIVRTPLSVAYIGLSVRVRHQRPAGGDDSPGLDDSRIEPGTRRPNRVVRVEHVLGEHDRLVIKGEAGSGKSTLLRWLAVTAARGGFKGDMAEFNNLVPFLVKLRSWEGENLPTPEHFLADAAPHLRGIMPDGFVHRALESGRALLLVDGVDELPTGERPKVRRWLSQLLTSFPRNRVVVTTRPTAADDFRFPGEGFTTAMLAPMSSSDVRELVRHWHLAVRDSGSHPCRSEDLPDYERDILKQIDVNPALRTLATTPLLCAMLCALNLDRRRDLPTDRVELYRAALAMLIERRDAVRKVSITIRNLGQAEKRTLLRDLAWRLSLNNRSELPYEVALARVADKLRSMPNVNHGHTAVFEYLLERSGVIRQPQSGRVDFVHRSFQEYLTAAQATDNGDIGVLVNHAHQDEWHEIVTLAAGLANAPQRTELITGLLHRADREPEHARRLRILVAACLETMPDLNPALEPRIDRTLAKLLPPHTRSEAASLARIGAPLLRYLPRVPEQLSDADASATIWAAALVNGPDALPVLRDLARDPRRRVQETLIDVWSHFNPVDYARQVLADAALLDGTVVITSAEMIPALPMLRHLKGTHIAFDTVEDLSILNDVPNLVSVAVRGEFDSIGPLERHPRLQMARLQSPVAFDPAPLARLPELRELFLTSTPGIDLGFLAECGGLRNLFVNSGGETGLAPIWSLSRLERLGLRGITADTDLSRLAELSRLRALSLSGTVDPERPAIPELLTALPDRTPELGNLTLFQLDLGDELGSVASLPKLTGLGLYQCTATDLAALPKFSALRSLEIEGYRTPLDVDSLAAIPQLRYLRLRHQSELTTIDLAAFGDRDLTIEVAGFHEVRNVGPGIRLRRFG